MRHLLTYCDKERVTTMRIDIDRDIENGPIFSTVRFDREESRHFLPALLPILLGAPVKPEWQPRYTDEKLSEMVGCTANKIAAIKLVRLLNPEWTLAAAKEFVETCGQYVNA